MASTYNINPLQMYQGAQKANAMYSLFNSGQGFMPTTSELFRNAGSGLTNLFSGSGAGAAAGAGAGASSLGGAGGAGALGTMGLESLGLAGSAGAGTAGATGAGAAGAGLGSLGGAGMGAMMSNPVGWIVYGVGGTAASAADPETFGSLPVVGSVGEGFNGLFNGGGVKEFFDSDALVPDINMMYGDQGSDRLFRQFGIQDSAEQIGGFFNNLLGF